jgi:hypothetical protein
VGEPYPNPVAFDKARADEAIRQLQALLKALGEHAKGRHSRARGMERDWTGPYADKFFKTEVPHMDRQAQQLVGEIQQAIRTISSYESAARSLQHQHDQANQRYQDEHKPSPEPQAPPVPAPQPPPPPPVP